MCYFAGLDYPGLVQSMLSFEDFINVEYVAATDDGAGRSSSSFSSVRQILQLKASHAIAEAVKSCSTIDKDKIIIINVSGRGDKDVAIARII